MQVLPHNEPIPPNALDPPHANAAQMLLWRPAKGRVGVVIAPKWAGAPPLTERDIRNPFITGEGESKSERRRKCRHVG